MSQQDDTPRQRLRQQLGKLEDCKDWFRDIVEWPDQKRLDIEFSEQLAAKLRDRSEDSRVDIEGVFTVKVVNLGGNREIRCDCLPKFQIGNIHWSFKIIPHKMSNFPDIKFL